MNIDEAIREAEEDLEQIPESPLRRQRVALLRFVQATDACMREGTPDNIYRLREARAAVTEALK